MVLRLAVNLCFFPLSLLCPRFSFHSFMSSQGIQSMYLAKCLAVLCRSQRALDGCREEFFPTANSGSPRMSFSPILRIGFCHAVADCVSPVWLFLFSKEGDVARWLRVTNQIVVRACVCLFLLVDESSLGCVVCLDHQHWSGISICDADASVRVLVNVVFSTFHSRSERVPISR